MKATTILATAVVIALMTSILHSQDILPYPPMNGGRPIVSATAEQVGDQYQYSYEVSNDTGAAQQVRDFMVGIQSTNVQGFAPDNWWASRASRPTLQAATWTSLDSTQDIISGTSLSGFQILSVGLPTIVKFYALGRIPIPHGEFRIVPGTNNPFINSAQGRTLGPKDPPTPFVELDFLDTLISMAEEALSLGWIEETYSEKIMNDLNDAREKMEESPEDAKEILEALIPYIIDDGCDWVPPDPSQYHLTSEGCALLRYNVEYLIEQIE